MSLRNVLLAATIALLSIAAVAGAGFAWFKLTPRRTPAGQPALSLLDTATLPAFREAFNAPADQMRMVVLLSPT